MRAATLYTDNRILKAISFYIWNKERKFEYRNVIINLKKNVKKKTGPGSMTILNIEGYEY